MTADPASGQSPRLPILWDRTQVWGDLVADQADGATGLDLDAEPAWADLDDERGYGFGV